MYRTYACWILTLCLVPCGNTTNAQTITSDPSLGITIVLPKNEINDVEIWVHNWSTTMWINGQFYSTDGVNHSSSKNLTIYGGGLKDVITMHGTSNTANVLVDLNGGDDEFYGQINRPLEVYGEDGDDTIFGGPHDDLLDGGPGDDELRGGPGDDHLHGRSNNDRLFGDEGTNYIHGGFGKDELYGGPHADVLVGCEVVESLGHYLNVPAWYGWQAPVPDFVEDQIHPGQGNSFILREVYTWSSYHIPNGFQVIIPHADAQKITLDQDNIVDYDPNSSMIIDFAVPMVTVKFLGAPRISF